MVKKTALRHSLLVAIALWSVLPVASPTPAAEERGPELVVFSLPDDEYYSLAEEIASSERAPLLWSWSDAFSRRPAAVAWVASPKRLDDARMIEAGKAMKSRGSMTPVGLVSGKDLETARRLWRRAKTIGFGQRMFYANGEYPAEGVPEARICSIGDAAPCAPMDRRSLAYALTRADYLTFSGHGGPDYLRIDPATKFTTMDLPDMPPALVSACSCNTFRLSQPESIALGFIEHGAAGYAGYVFSPTAGYTVGATDGLPFRYTWPGFPVGMVVALQNRGARQGFAAFPYLFFLGDPRISLLPSQPYSLKCEESVGGGLVVRYRDVPEGVVPVRIDGGGKYSYVQIPGLADTADGDPFFNSRMQAASFQGDKYIIVHHPGGDLTLRLTTRPPFLWWLARGLSASLDHVALFSPLGGGDWIMAALGFLALVSAAALMSRRRMEGRATAATLAFSAAAGAAFALSLGLYQALRLPFASITTKPLAMNVLWLVGVGELTAAGCCLYLLSCSRFGKVAAAVVAAFPPLIPALFGLSVVAAYNLMFAGINGTGIYNYNNGLLSLIAVAPWLAAHACILIMHSVLTQESPVD